MPFERDEGEYAYSAWLMQQNIMPYENSFLQKPPMIIYTYMLGQLFDGDSILPPRILATLSLVLTLLLTGLLVSREFNRWTGIVSVWLMAPMLTLPVLSPFAANTEVFMLLPLLGVLFCYSHRTWSNDGLLWFVAGVCSALAILFKPISITVCAFVFLVWFFESRRRNQHQTVHARSALFAIGGFVISSLVLLSPFLLHDSGKTFWECAVEYNWYFAQFATEGFGPAMFFLKEFFNNWWILILLLIFFLIRRPAKWWFSSSLLLISLLTIYKSAAGHYYFIVVPFLAIISALSLNSFFEQFKKYFSQHSALKKNIVLAVVIVLVTLPILPQYSKSSAEMIEWFYGTMNPFNEAGIVAEKVKALSTPDDVVFVAGSEPEIYFYAKRKSPTRFVIMYPLMLQSPFVLKYQQETIRDLQEHPPEVIVFSRSKNSWLTQKQSPKFILAYLNQLLKNEYEIKGGFDIQSKQWEDSLTTNQYQQSSLVVYKRKISTASPNNQ